MTAGVYDGGTAFTTTFGLVMDGGTAGFSSTSLAPLGPNSVVLGSVTLGAIGEDGVERTLETLQGWGSPKTTLTVTQYPRAVGGFPSEAFLQPRSLVLAGTLCSTSPTALAQAKDDLVDAAAINGTTLTVTEAGYGDRTMQVWRNDEVLFGDEADTWTSYSVQLVAPDPRKYGPLVSQQTGMPVQSGGLMWPVTWPIRWDATVVTGLLEINNPGNITAPVLLRIAGPVSGPIITHVGSGAQLVFSSSLTLGAGEWLTVDMESRTVLANGQARRDGYVTSRGWFGLDPGPNSVLFQASTYSASALLTVTAPQGAWQ